MVLDCAFASPRDDNNVLDSGGDRFFHGILNQRLVDERQHLFGGGFGRGEEASTEACSRNHGFANVVARHVSILCDGVGDVKESRSFQASDKGASGLLVYLV